MGVGERVRDVRLRAGLTQVEFGRALGVSKNTQIRYERGQRRPDSAYLLAVAEKFGADINELLHGAGDPGRYRFEWSREDLDDAARAAFETLVPHDLDAVIEWLDERGLASPLSEEESVLLKAFRGLDGSGRFLLETVLEALRKGKKP